MNETELLQRIEARLKERPDLAGMVDQVVQEQTGGQYRSLDALRQKVHGGGSVGDMVAGVARSAAKGASFGFNDELEAGLRTLGGLAGDYKATRDEIRQQEAQFASDHPILSTGAELAGGFVPVTGIASRLGMATKLLPRASARLMEASAKYASKATPTFLQQMGRGIGAGSAMGALAGAGNAQELSDVPSTALAGGLVGGATGAVLTPIGGFVANRVAKRLAGTSGEDKATRMANRALTSSIKDAGGVDALAAQRAADEALRPGMTSLADQSAATAAMADAAVATSPAARQQFVAGLRDRSQTELARLQSDFRQATGLDPSRLNPEMMARKLDELRTARFSGKGGSYERWADRTNDLAGRMERIDPASPIAKADQGPMAAGNEKWWSWKQFGEKYGTLMRKAGIEPPTSDAPSAKAMQQFRMELSDAKYHPEIGPLFREQAGQALAEVDQVLAEKSPAFKVIQKNFARQMRREEAVQYGVDAIKAGSTANPAAIADDIAAMAPHEQEWARRGMAAQIAQQMGGIKMDRSIAKRLFSGIGVPGQTDNASEVIRRVFKSPKALQDFVNKVDLEERMAVTAQVGGNSLSAQRMALQEAIGKGEGLGFKVLRALGYTGPTGAGFTAAANLLSQGNPELRKDVATKVAQGLLDPRLAGKTLKRAKAGMVEDNLRSLWFQELNPQMTGLLGQLAAGKLTR